MLHNILTILHPELDHMEMNKLEDAVWTQFLLPYLRKDILGFRKTCERCVSLKSPNGTRFAPLKLNELVEADIVGPLLETLGQQISTRPHSLFHQVVRGCLLKLSGFNTLS